jgi:5-methylcytosine-specific restriction endonuclease McrA
MDKKILEKNAHPAQIRDKFICQYCGEDGLASIENWRNSSIDHFIPLVNGGTYELDNLVTACSYCNSLKHGKKFNSIDDVKKFIKQRKEEDRLFVEKLRNAFK